MDLSILIASYNTRELTLACLDSVYQQTRSIGFEVIVVDNASADGSADAIAERYPQVRLIRSTKNLGFAGANNLAGSQAVGDHLLLLNPDTVILDAAIEKLLRFVIEQAGDVIAGGRTLFANGSLNPESCHGRETPWSLFCAATGLMSLFRHSRLFDPESLGHWQRDTFAHVDIVSGCFMMMSRSLWGRLDGFSPEFFMYGEDADLCLRAAKMGARCLICPEATIIHCGGASEPTHSDKMVRMFQAKVRLFRRHWNWPWRPLGIMAIDLWALVRLVAFSVIRLVHPARRQAYETWRSIYSRRAEWRADRLMQSPLPQTQTSAT